MGYITQDEAKTECSDLGLGYALITNDQWMTVANNIAAVADNWDGGTVGTSSINVGHNDNSPDAALSAGDTLDPCADTGEICDFSTWNLQRRTHKLSNGEFIWDMSGNLWEWIDYVIDAVKQLA